MAVKAELIPVSVKIEEEKVPGEIIYLFPGQGVQEVGMGKALYENSEIARTILNQLKPELLDAMFNGPRGDQPIDVLDDTANAQPAIVAVSLATYFAFFETNPSFMERRPFAFLGHSTGQVSAMGAARIVDIEIALRIAAERGRLMKEVGERGKNQGGMLALLGTTLEQAELLCLRANTSEVLGGKEGIWIANDNTIGQIVLSGRERHIGYAEDHAKEAGIIKVKRLPVFIAAHCPLMKEAQDRFAKYLDRIEFRRPTSAIILNTRAAATLDPGEIKTDLINGLTQGVRYRKALEEAQRNGATSFIEIGKGPLSGFVQKAIPDSMQFQITT